VLGRPTCFVVDHGHVYMSVCILQVGDGGEQKPWRSLALVGKWLAISKKVVLQKLKDPEASVLLGGPRFFTRISPERCPAPTPAGPGSRRTGEKGHAQSTPLLRIMSQPLASSRPRYVLTWWLCLDSHD